MTDRGKLQQDADRGKQAERLLSDPLLVEALEALEKDATDRWAMSDPVTQTTAQREQFHMAVVTARKFKGYLRSVLQGGKMALEHMAQQDRREAAKKSTRR